MKRVSWNRDELIVAFNLYCKIPFTKINASNKRVIELSGILGRSVSAVALKLANFARLDPALQSRNISGMRHGSKSELEIWNEFHGNWDQLTYESETILAELQGKSIEELAGIDLDSLPKEGKTKERLVRTRINQNFFRASVLASYDNRCCITGLQLPDLLVASHIVPWSADEKNRMNPANGLCLNALHDRAFDRGLLTITPDYRIQISKSLLKQQKHPAVEVFFLPYIGSPINMPQRFLPDKGFLEYHNKNVFLGG